MKHWYIIVDGYEQECEMISVNILNRVMYLRYLGVSVRVLIHEFNDYSRAVQGIVLDTWALSKKGNKQIKIVFK